VTPTHSLEDRIKSIRLFSEVMNGINAEASRVIQPVSK
jgi:hypothetical protein